MKSLKERYIDAIFNIDQAIGNLEIIRNEYTGTISKVKLDRLIIRLVNLAKTMEKDNLRRTL